MTTNTSPAGPDRRVLHAHDPAELLAETRICLGRIPEDCLILVGHDGDLGQPLMTSSGLTGLLALGGREHLEHHLGMMRGRGCRRAFALLVVGDGYEEIPEELLADLTVAAASVLLATTSLLLPEPFPLESVWVAGNAEGRQVLDSGDDAEGITLLISPPTPLRPFSETAAAAGAVYTGQPVPQVPEGEHVLARIGRSLHLTRTDLAADCDPGELFAAARESLGRLRTARGSLDERDVVTDCEQVAALLSAVAVDRLHWELLAQCIDHGNIGSIDREELLQILVSDPRWTPDAAVCAGGSWYEGIDALRVVAAAAADEPASGHRGTAREAWRGLTAMLVMLAWWNHRFATAGALVDELRGREPTSTLAPLLARMTDTPIFPAWWPST